jgi:signal peptidase I
MTLNADPSIKPSPWLSVWFAPRETIARILATNPRRHVLLLFSLLSGLDVAILLIDAKMLDWRLLLAGFLAGAVFGIPAIYIVGLVFSWAGKLLGGRATALQLRAVVAWGCLPLLIALLFGVTTKLALQSAANVGEDQAKALDVVVALVVLVLAVWGIVATLLMLARVQGFGFFRTIFNFVFAYIVTLLLAILVALPIRTFLFQPFNVASASMMPTLLVGDYMFVSKFSYGYSRYSFPFSPPFAGRIFAAEPRLGDVVVFRNPMDMSVYVKRIVGLPNDRIQMIDGVLNINGTPIKHERVEDFAWVDQVGGPSQAKRWRETLPNGVSYTTLDMMDNGMLDNTPVFTVPPGHYFVIGDNLDNSVDSRMPQFGSVPFENLLGRVEFIYFSKDSAGSERFDRIGRTPR